MSVFLSFSFEILETHVLFSGVFAFFLGRQRYSTYFDLIEQQGVG